MPVPPEGRVAGVVLDDVAPGGIRRRRILALVLSAAVFGAACGGSSSSSPTTPSPSGTPSLVSVTVVPPQLRPGDSGNASAWGWTTQNNSPIYGPLAVTGWATSHPAIAAVDSAGRVTANASGTARLTATYPGGVATGSVLVYTEAEVTGLDIACPSPARLPGGVFCQAFGRTRTANRVEVRVVWSSSNHDVATVGSAPAPSNIALVLGHAPGETVITATFGDLQASATVVFEPPRG